MSERTKTCIDDVPFEMEVFSSLSKWFRSTSCSAAFRYCFYLSPTFCISRWTLCPRYGSGRFCNCICFSVLRLSGHLLFISGGCPKGTLMDTGKTQALGLKSGGGKLSPRKATMLLKVWHSSLGCVLELAINQGSFGTRREVETPLQLSGNPWKLVSTYR